MSAMESMVRTILNTMDIDVEKMKGEVTTRITAFEKNVETLNNTLISHQITLDRIETKLDLLFAHFGIEKPSVLLTANTEKDKSNDDAGTALSKIA